MPFVCLFILFLSFLFVLSFHNRSIGQKRFGAFAYIYTHLCTTEIQCLRFHNSIVFIALFSSWIIIASLEFSLVCFRFLFLFILFFVCFCFCAVCFYCSRIAVRNVVLFVSNFQNEKWWNGFRWNRFLRFGNFWKGKRKNKPNKQQFCWSNHNNIESFDVRHMLKRMEGTKKRPIKFRTIRSNACF